MRSNLPPEQLARILQQVDDDSVHGAAPSIDDRQRLAIVGAQGVRVVALDVPWGELFLFSLKLALVSVPAIWIAVFAYKVPAMLIDVLTVAKVGH